MTKHLADHEQPDQASGMAHVMRIARSDSESFWKVLWKGKGASLPANRAIVEFARIERGHLG